MEKLSKKGTNLIIKKGISILIHMTIILIGATDIQIYLHR